MVDPDLATLYSIILEDIFIQMLHLATMDHRISVLSLIIISPNLNDLIFPRVIETS